MSHRSYPVDVEKWDGGFVGRTRLGDGREVSLRAASLRRLPVGLTALIAALEPGDEDTITLRPAVLRSLDLPADGVPLSLEDRRREPGSLGNDGAARILRALVGVTPTEDHAL